MYTASSGAGLFRKNLQEMIKMYDKDVKALEILKNEFKTDILDKVASSGNTFANATNFYDSICNFLYNHRDLDSDSNKEIIRMADIAGAAFGESFYDNVSRRHGITSGINDEGFIWVF